MEPNEENTSANASLEKEMVALIIMAALFGIGLYGIITGRIFIPTTKNGLSFEGYWAKVIGAGMLVFSTVWMALYLKSKYMKPKD